MAESSLNGKKTLWGKEKLLVMSNFFFSHKVFKRLLLYTRRNQGLCGKGLKERKHCGKSKCWLPAFFPLSTNVLFQELMKVIVIGFITVSRLSLVSTMAMWESSQWLEKNIEWSIG